MTTLDLNDKNLTVDTYKEPYVEVLSNAPTERPITLVVDTSSGDTIIGELVGARRVNGKATPRVIFSHAGDIPYELGETLDDEEGMDLIIREWEVSLTEG